ncbi:hypothetical protein IAT38_007317 [Cryptococcus sp. DSM 104549]
MPPSSDPEAQRLAAEDYEFHDDEDDDHDAHNAASGSGSGTSHSAFSAMPSRSQYHLPASEQLRGVANRIIFSRYYILFYGAMMGLSLATLVLSLIATHKDQCPPVAWHILEVVLNLLMVLEVSTRWVAYGKKYPLTLLNLVDLVLVFFCAITLILVFRNPCSSGTRSEELLDTILLIIRNTVQFLRLGHILRRSGHSFLNPPKPIDLSQARDAAFALDLDDMDEEQGAERRLFDAHLEGSGGGGGPGGRRTLAGGSGGRYELVDGEEREQRRGTGVKDNAGREGLGEEDEEMWDRIG